MKADGDKPSEGGALVEAGEGDCKELRLSEVEMKHHSLPWKVVTFYTTSDAFIKLLPVLKLSPVIKLAVYSFAHYSVEDEVSIVGPLDNSFHNKERDL